MELDFIEDESVKTKVQEALSSALEQEKSKFKETLDSEVAGLKNKIEEFKGEKVGLQEKLNQFAEVDMDEFNRIKEMLQDERKSKLLAEGNIEAYAQEFALKENSELRTVFEEKENELTNQIDNLLNESNKYKSLYQTKTRDDMLSVHARKAGVTESAIPDVLLRASLVFNTITDDGKVEARDKDGAILKTSDDKILDINNWLIERKSDSAHWWGSTTPAGLSGSNLHKDATMRKAQTGDAAGYIADRLKQDKVKSRF